MEGKAVRHSKATWACACEHSLEASACPGFCLLLLLAPGGWTVGGASTPRSPRPCNLDSQAGLHLRSLLLPIHRPCLCVFHPYTNQTIIYTSLSPAPRRRPSYPVGAQSLSIFIFALFVVSHDNVESPLLPAKSPAHAPSHFTVMAEIRRKLVIVGDGACGKTCLLM